MPFRPDRGLLGCVVEGNVGNSAVDAGLGILLQPGSGVDLDLTNFQP